MEQMEISQPIIQPQNNSLPGPINVLSRAWQIYKSRMETFLGIMVAPSLIASLGIILSYVELSLIWMLSSYIILYLLATLFGLWSQIALLYAIKDRESNAGAIDAFKKGLKKIIPFWSVNILVFLVFSGGLLLLLAPAILFSIWFTFSAYLVVDEDLNGIKALIRSKQLVKDKVFSLAWRFLVIGIVIAFLQFSFALPFNLLFREEAFSNLARAVLPIFFAPFALISSYLVYEDLKKLKYQEPPKTSGGKKYIVIATLGVLLWLVAAGAAFFGLSVLMKEFNGVENMNFENLNQEIGSENWEVPDFKAKEILLED